MKKNKLVFVYISIILVVIIFSFFLRPDVSSQKSDVPSPTPPPVHVSEILPTTYKKASCDTEADYAKLVTYEGYNYRFTYPVCGWDFSHKEDFANISCTPEDCPKYSYITFSVERLVYKNVA